MNRYLITRIQKIFVWNGTKGFWVKNKNNLLNSELSFGDERSIYLINDLLKDPYNYPEISYKDAYKILNENLYFYMDFEEIITKFKKLTIKKYIPKWKKEWK